MTDVPWSPAFACSATVPPQPRSSSSGCAAITSTRLGMGEPLARPRLVAELAALEDGPVLGLHVEQDDRAATARDELPAGVGVRAHHRADHIAGVRARDRDGGGRQGGVPDL